MLCPIILLYTNVCQRTTQFLSCHLTLNINWEYRRPFVNFTSLFLEIYIHGWHETCWWLMHSMRSAKCNKQLRKLLKSTRIYEIIESRTRFRDLCCRDNCSVAVILHGMEYMLNDVQLFQIRVRSLTFYGVFSYHGFDNHETVHPSVAKHTCRGISQVWHKARKKLVPSDACVYSCCQLYND